MKLISYEILDHGRMIYSDYFQGCGTAFTNFTHVWTGAGESKKDAYNDALEQAYMEIGDLADKFQKRPAGFRMRPRILHDGDDEYFFCNMLKRIKEGEK